MKSMAELEAIRKKTLERINLRREDESDNVRVVVGMATCGIAAGARCIGMCRLEPMVDVYMPGKEKVTYVHMTPEKVGRVVAEHIVNGRPVTEFTIGAAEE